MSKQNLIICFAILILSISGQALAQEEPDYHPALSDNFTVSLGAFKSDDSFKIAAGDLTALSGTDIDFGDSVGVDNTDTILNGQLRWKFGKKRKWSLSGQYFGSKSSGDATLDEDVEFQGLTFREGTFVEGSVSVSVARVFVGRSLVKNQQHDFGVGAGVHNLSLKAHLGGEVKIDDVTTGFQEANAKASQPLPNICAWYNFSPARKWIIHGRVDWISANIDAYDGTLWNTSVGVGYQAFRHVGFDLSYQYFNLNLKVDKDDWIGGVDMTYQGPVLGITGNW